MKSIYLKTTANALFVFFMFACSSNSEQTNLTDDHHDHHENSNIVNISKPQSETIGLKLGTLTEQNMSSEVVVNGTIELPPQHRADISPLMGGVVKQINVIEGDKVKKGQVLVTIQHPDIITLQAEYRTNLNNLKFTKAEYERQLELNKEKVTSDKVFQKIETEYKNLLSTIDAQKRELEMLGINIKGVENGQTYTQINLTAPFNGSVSKVSTKIGSYAQPMVKLIELVNNDEIHADFMVYEKDIHKIKVGQNIKFTAPGISNEIDAVIHNISPVFEQDPKAIHLHADILGSKKELIPGIYINGRILTDNQLTSVLPEEAVVEENGKYYIFVLNESHENHHQQPHQQEEAFTFTKTEIKIGKIANGFIEIKPLTPLVKDQKIAISGSYFLLSEMTKEENEHEH